MEAITDHLWDDLLTAQDREVIARAGYGRKRGLGTRPALLVIDCQYNYIGADAPILEQLDQYPQAGGAAAWNAVRKIVKLVDAARSATVPVVYTRIRVPEAMAKHDPFTIKRGGANRFAPSAPGVEIVKELAPRPDELVVDKISASAMYGTPLLTYLVRREVDSLVVTGVSTGGCVRATAVDGVSMGFNVAVVEDCVADRITLSHKAALLDIWMKYADVIGSDEAREYISRAGRAAKSHPG